MPTAEKIPHTREYRGYTINLYNQTQVYKDGKLLGEFSAEEDAEEFIDNLIKHNHIRESIRNRLR